MTYKKEQELKVRIAEEEKKVGLAISRLQEAKAHSIASKIALDQDVSEEEETFLSSFISKRQAILNKWKTTKQGILRAYSITSRIALGQEISEEEESFLESFRINGKPY